MIRQVVTQLRTTDLEASIRFYTERLGFTLGWRYGEGYAAILADDRMFHLKRVDASDPSIAEVAAHGHFHLYFYTDDLDAVAARDLPMVEPPHDTPWGMREMIVTDDQGHTLYFGQATA